MISEKYTKLFLTAGSMILAAVIGFIGYLSGSELALSVFYLFPITLVTWYVGLGAGMLLSVTSAVSLLFADLMRLNSFSKPFIPFLNETFRLTVFIIITYVIYKLQKSLELQKVLARTDPLTAVANRRTFFDLAKRELNNARRYQLPISVLFMDIDDFKRINDLFGHHVGDRLLCSVAKTIETNIRSIDIIARFGGDEFGILLSATEAESAALVVRKLKKKLLNLMQSNGWPVTFSFGVATFKTPPDSIIEMISAADTQMYLAKQNGKNQIQFRVIFEEDHAYGSIAGPIPGIKSI
jgi:diguanylate cyclase (GGDEF)-like protein